MTISHVFHIYIYCFRFQICFLSNNCSVIRTKKSSKMVVFFRWYVCLFNRIFQMFFYSIHKRNKLVVTPALAYCCWWIQARSATLSGDHSQWRKALYAYLAQVCQMSKRSTSGSYWSDIFNIIFKYKNSNPFWKCYNGVIFCPCHMFQRVSVFVCACCIDHTISLKAATWNDIYVLMHASK